MTGFTKPRSSELLSQTLCKGDCSQLLQEGAERFLTRTPLDFASLVLCPPSCPQRQLMVCHPIIPITACVKVDQNSAIADQQCAKVDQEC